MSQIVHEPATESASEGRIGRYSIAGRLATGGMAEILLGVVAGPNGFERPVVIKRVRAHLAAERSFIRMFLDEASLTSEIRHPNVAQVFELAQSDGELYIVMEYLHGESISSIMRALAARHQLFPPLLAAHIVAEACAGLHAAHELTDDRGRLRGVVHRDVAPQNLFVTYDGSVKVLDFGIAKAAGRLVETEVGAVKGRLHYMSPEQCTAGHVDRRSDVFALGVVAFELLTGFHLFRRDNPAATVHAVLHSKLRPPSAFRPDVSAELDAVCARALERDPNRRFQTAAEMRRGLVRTLERGGELLPDEMLRAWMAELFQHRMQAKREMIRLASAGASDLAPLPAPTDEELPDVTRAQVSRPGRSRRALVIGLLAAGAAAGALAAAAWASTWEPASSSQVRVRIESVPAATLYVRGRKPDRTPAEIALVRSDRPVAIRLAAPGHLELAAEVVPRADARLVFELEAIERPANQARVSPTPPGLEAAPAGEPLDRVGGESDLREDSPEARNRRGGRRSGRVHTMVEPSAEVSVESMRLPSDVVEPWR